jgi:Na+-transporting methylmalonyl-CoA/oxaloacetate decarboxylase gamma subunit
LHRPLDKWNSARRDGSDQLTVVLAINGIVVLVLLVLAWAVPSASEWISAAVQAEFVNPDLTTNAPTQIARPVDQMRIVRSN